MILDELVLHDFGVYGGRQALSLTPAAPDRPVVLIGGLNGGGKTTILEALQICLYGSAAACVGRGSGGYDDFLRRRIHRGRDAREAGLELAFRHRSDGVEHAWRVIRSWSAGPKTCRETVEVLRDGRLDPLATANWAEQVEEFLPSRIASLFLFDGEKVETYADPDEAPALIASAIQNLLGLDVVERLSSDLTTLERRKRAERPAVDAGPAADARMLVERLEAERLLLQRRSAECADALDRARRDLRVAEDRFRREGGSLYERRIELERQAATSARRLEEVERDLHEASAGSAPLLLVADLLASAATRDMRERETVRSGELARALGEEHAAILALPELTDLPIGALGSLEHAMAERRSEVERAAAQPIELALEPEAGVMLAALMKDVLPETRLSVEELVRRAASARSAVEDGERTLAAAPSGGDLEKLAFDRDELQLAVARLESDGTAATEALAALDRELTQVREREARLAEAEAMERFKAEDADRVLAHSARVRGTLMKFREAVIARHVRRIEGFVLESFQRLVRKGDLVTALHIDLQSFALELVGSDGGRLTPAQLSAGERQLLAISILWGLARASGRPLPTVIDTPLGRLDSRHRARLVERYFPAASHQVLLLSTDEEIFGEYLKMLAPSVGRSYSLEFDEVVAGTVIREGYLERQELLDVA